jgi:hypothetical protein
MNCTAIGYCTNTQPVRPIAAKHPGHSSHAPVPEAEHVLGVNAELLNRLLVGGEGRKVLGNVRLLLADGGKSESAAQLSRLKTIRADWQAMCFVASNSTVMRKFSPSRNTIY